MPVSSLPSKYGIGGFGKSAFDFIDFLRATGQRCWQVLPLNPTSYGDSPYQSPASSAGNPYFIDLDVLEKKKLLTKDEVALQRNNSKIVNYGWLYSTRYDILRVAHSRFKPDKEYQRFCKVNAGWLEKYALFMSLKMKFNQASWTSWDEEYKNYSTATTRASDFEPETSFWRWVQYEFSVQWSAVRKYAHTRGISIIGDMPIYVAHDSVDVWSAPEQFLLDGELRPTVVAGCPPDGFSPDGQLWGNPIYDWDKMRADGFNWWCERVGSAFRLYDILRIDHFRGFAGFYQIPYGDSTAKNGKWVSAPGIELFEQIKRRIPKHKIVAEDLGFITDDVRELLTRTGFPGMKILHFAFGEENSEYLPRTYKTENCVVYTGSHDSECTRTWCKNLTGRDKEIFDKECPKVKGYSRTYDVISLAMSSIANLAIIPIQDYLTLESKDGRMNNPGIAEGNWGYRLSPRYNTHALRSKILEVTTKHKRNV